MALQLVRAILLTMTSRGWQNALQKADQLKWAVEALCMDRSCYIILLVLILLCRGWLYHTTRFGIEGYHAIIKIARLYIIKYDST